MSLSLMLIVAGLVLGILLLISHRSAFAGLLWLAMFCVFVQSGLSLLATMRLKRSSTVTRRLRGIASGCMMGLSFSATMLAAYALSLATILQVASIKMAPRSEKKFEKISSGLLGSRATSKRRTKRRRRSKNTSG